jgi:hypothetical protein
MGLSAQAIRGYGRFHPHDPSDLCRCLAIQKNPPEHMRGVSAEWAILVDHWRELADMLAEEHPSGRAPKTYARMQELFAIARQTKGQNVTDNEAPVLASDTCECGHQRWQHKRLRDECRGEPGKPGSCACQSMQVDPHPVKPQPSPLAAVDDIVRARTEDPETSHIAAQSLSSAKSQCRALLTAGWLLGPAAEFTDEELALRCNLVKPGVCWWHRCSDLRKLGLIEWVRDDGGRQKKQTGSNGRPVGVSKLTDAGMKAAAT